MTITHNCENPKSEVRNSKTENQYPDPTPGPEMENQDRRINHLLVALLKYSMPYLCLFLMY